LDGTARGRQVTSKFAFGWALSEWRHKQPPPRHFAAKVALVAATSGNLKDRDRLIRDGFSSSDAKRNEAMARAQVASKPRRRWRQFGLRTLGLLILLAALGMTVWRTLLAEHFLVQWIERQKGTATTEPALPNWLAWLPGSGRCVHITEVYLYGCRVGDDDLGRFKRLPKLRKLMLSRTDVTLPAVEAFVSAKPELDCDLAFGEHLYHAAWSLHLRGFEGIEATSISFDLAEHYKIAVARISANGNELEIAAIEQHLQWLDKLSKQSRATANAPTADLMHFYDAYLQCADAKLRLRLAEKRGDAQEFQRLAAQAPQLSNDLISAGRDAQDPVINSLASAWALHSASSLRLAALGSQADAAQRRAVYAWLAPQFRRLDDMVTTLHFFRCDGGESDAWALCRLLRLENEAQILTAQQDDLGAERIWRQVPLWSDRLRLAVMAARDAGAITAEGSVACAVLANQVECTAAQAMNDKSRCQTARGNYQSWVDQTCRTECQRTRVTTYGSLESPKHIIAFWLCAAMTAHVEDEGRPFFEHGFRAYLKKQFP
jgi:hypothetical protein